MDYDAFFQIATGFDDPYPWQRAVAMDAAPDVLSIPTGLGKTEGIVLGWAYRRLVLRDEATPRHLVFCLPMRVLVRQTFERLVELFGRLREAGIGDVLVDRLVGGERTVDDPPWTLEPAREWALVGTQDQLLSRALNRGYAVSPYTWPVHFGLLNNDCHWVLDEVQLMGPAVWTSAQLDWMRRERFGTVKPCTTTWMSATLGCRFLATRDRREADLLLPRTLEIGPKDEAHPRARVRLAAVRRIGRFEPSTSAAKGTRSKRKRKPRPPTPSAIADAIIEAHVPGTLSLVVCNTVSAAQAIFDALPVDTPKRLVTSRFRANDRRATETTLHGFESRRRKSGPRVDGHPGLILVSTQVIEAGVDVSAHRLWSELAPWPSIIQRLGRMNRDGLDNEAVAMFWEPLADAETVDKAFVGPYPRESIDIARHLLDRLVPLSGKGPARAALSRLAKLDESTAAAFQQALELAPAPLPRAVDVHALFVTERDVYGGFTDVSPFVRTTLPIEHAAYASAAGLSRAPTFTSPAAA